MKNIIVFIGLLLCLAGFFSVAHSAKQKKIIAQELFNIKCTKCHPADEALKRHESKERFLVIIKTMQLGANVSDPEMEQIASFLGDPNRILFEVKCTQCHDVNRIQQVHLERKTAIKLKRLIERMRKKDESGISEKDAAAIYQYLISFY